MSNSYIEIDESGYPVMKYDKRYTKFDDKGIPFVNYGIINSGNVGEQRNPVFIALKTIEEYKKYQRTKNEKARSILIDNARWLVTNSVIHDQHAILEYQYSWPVYNMKKPWRSAMAQGLALQALVKAHMLTCDPKYLEHAKKILNSFYVEVKDRGVTYKDNYGWWYEEYAHENGITSRVPNGMMYAVLGIYDYYQYTADPNEIFLFEKGINALKHDISRYDFNGYSYYDILGKSAGEKYHTVHVAFSKLLYDITNEQIFQSYYGKWRKYRAIEKPVLRLLAAFLILSIKRLF